MNFKRTTEANPANAGCLQEYVDFLEVSDIIELFGPSDKDGYEDYEKGYDGQEWHFEAEDGQIVNLYPRFSNLRVGASNNPIAQDFVAWLKSGGN